MDLVLSGFQGRLDILDSRDFEEPFLDDLAIDFQERGILAHQLHVDAHFTAPTVVARASLLILDPGNHGKSSPNPGLNRLCGCGVSLIDEVDLQVSSVLPPAAAPVVQVG